jgi:hypothetical protein
MTAIGNLAVDGQKRAPTNGLRILRRSIRPMVLALLRALPSPEGCGCQARKEWMIRKIETI